MATLATVIATTLSFVMAAVPQESDRLVLVVGFEPGGTSSMAARIVADKLEEVGGVSVLVENRPGAGGYLAAEYVRQQKDSKTLLFMSATSLLNVSPQLGLVPVGLVGTFDYVAVGRRDGPQTLDAYAKAAMSNDELRSMATAGAGSIAHLIGMKLFEGLGLKMVHVPYRGSAPAITAVLGGHVPLAIVPFPDFFPRKDALHVVARTGQGIETGGWVGIFASPGTPHRSIERLTAVFKRASELTKERLEGAGFKQEWQSGEELSKRYAEEYAAWQPLLAKLNVKP